MKKLRKLLQLLLNPTSLSHWIDSNASDTTDEDESSSDEELVEKLPDDMSWYDYSTTTCQLIFQFLQVPLWKL